jgi:hypothetical protein
MKYSKRELAEVARWTDEIEQDYRSWLKENEDHLTVPRERLEKDLAGPRID